LDHLHATDVGLHAKKWQFLRCCRNIYFNVFRHEIFVHVPYGGGSVRIRQGDEIPRERTIRKLWGLPLHCPPKWPIMCLVGR